MPSEVMEYDTDSFFAEGTWHLLHFLSLNKTKHFIQPYMTYLDRKIENLSTPKKKIVGTHVTNGPK